MTQANWTRLLWLILLAIPGLGAASVLGLDTLMHRMLGSALTSSGFVGGLLGLAAFLAGYVAILAWPVVVFLTLRTVRSSEVPRFIRIGACLVCLGATYAAAYWMVWFVILPWQAAR